MKARETLCLTRCRTRVVGEDDPRAAFLLAQKGQEIPEAVAQKHGLTDGALPAPDISTPRNNVAPEGAPVQRGPGRPPKTP